MSSLNWINQKELEFIKGNNFLSVYPNLLKSLSEPRFTIADLGVTPRDATYWDQKGVLPQLAGKSTTRRKYTLKQAIWIKLIQQLRGFDISLNKIKAIKSTILGAETSNFDLLQNEQVAEVVKQLAKETGHLAQIQELLNNPEFLAHMQQEMFDIFEHMILYTIVFRRSLGYILANDGTGIPYCVDKHPLIVEEIPELKELFLSSYLYISISDAYRQLIVDWSEKSWFDEISIVTNQEAKIINLLRDERTAELKVFKKNNAPERVIQTSKLNKIDVANFADYIVKNGYQKIEAQTKNGKIISFKNELSLLLNIPEEPEE